MPRTGIAPCPACSELVITAALPGGIPVTLDRHPDGQGVIAAQQTALGAWLARRETPGVALGVTEKRYAIHCCTREGAEAAQDGDGAAAWKAARAAQGTTARRRRGRRDKPVTGVRWGGPR